MIKNKFWADDKFQFPHSAKDVLTNPNNYGFLLNIVGLTEEDRAVILSLTNIDLQESEEHIATDIEHELRRAYQKGLRDALKGAKNE